MNPGTRAQLCNSCTGNPAVGPGPGNTVNSGPKLKAADYCVKASPQNLSFYRDKFTYMLCIYMFPVFFKMLHRTCSMNMALGPVLICNKKIHCFAKLVDYMCFVKHLLTTIFCQFTLFR